MAKVTLGLDDSQLKAGLVGSEARLNKFANTTKTGMQSISSAATRAFAFAGASVGIASVTHAVRGLLSDFDDIHDSAIKLGVGAESFQRIKLAADLSGASVDGLTTALLKMEAGLQRGGAEGEKLSNALASLGISTASFLAAKPEERLAMLAAAFQTARAEGRGLAEIQDLFKKQFADLIPLLSSTSDELAKVAQHKVVSQADIDRLAAANDALGTMGNKLKVIAGEQVAGVLRRFELASKPGGLNPFSENFYVTAEKREKLAAEGAANMKALNIGPDVPISPPPSGMPDRMSDLPGFEAATGVNPDLLGLPGFSAATGPQSATAQAAKPSAPASKYDKEQLEALKLNNALLEKLASYN